MHQPQLTAIVYRVSYRRSNWKPGNWKNKLFNTEGSATKYAESLRAPVTDDTPEKYRSLAPVEIELSYAAVRWEPIHGVVFTPDTRPQLWHGRTMDEWAELYESAAGVPPPDSDTLQRFIDSMKGQT